MTDKKVDTQEWQVPVVKLRLTEPQQARLLELLKGRREISADYTEFTDDEALELIQIMHNCPPANARAILNRSRAAVVRDVVPRLSPLRRISQ